MAEPAIIWFKSHLNTSFLANQFQKFKLHSRKFGRCWWSSSVPFFFFSNMPFVRIVFCCGFLLLLVFVFGASLVDPDWLSAASATKIFGMDGFHSAPHRCERLAIWRPCQRSFHSRQKSSFLDFLCMQEFLLEFFETLAFENTFCLV